MCNAAYIISFMWNSISGLDTWYHFRFNISCGVPVKVRCHQNKYEVLIRCVWPFMNIFGSLWVSLDLLESLWVSLGLLGSLWFSLGLLVSWLKSLFGSLLVSCLFGSPWIFVGLLGTLSLLTQESLFVSLGVLGSLLVSLSLFGSPSVSLDLLWEIG